MSAQIIAFSVRETPEWPRGSMGKQLEKIALRMTETAQEEGRRLSIESARRRVLSGYVDMCARLEAGRG